MKRVDVCIIILNYNGYELTKNCLNSIKKNTSKKIKYKVIVVDDCSNDDSKIKIKKEFKWIDFIQNKKNFRFSKANNIGIKYALKKYDLKYIFLLNNDTKVKSGWLENAIKVAELDEKIGIVGCNQKDFSGKIKVSVGWIHPFGVKYYLGNEIKEVNWAMGACLLIKKEVFKKIGFFDEGFFPSYYEETDFEWRCKKAGFKIFFSPKSIVYHKGGATLEKEGKSAFIWSFYKNRIRYFVGRYGFFYFIPRIFYDFIKQRKNIKLLLKAYFDGLKSLKEKPLIQDKE